MPPVIFQPMSTERARYIIAHPAEFAAQSHTIFFAAWRVLRAPLTAPAPSQPGDAA